MARMNFCDEKYWEKVAVRPPFRPGLLSVALGISQRQLQRYTRKTFGCSPHHWLNIQRLKLAGVLLLEGRSAKLACYELGFKQPSHFSRTFKRHYGLSPSDFLACYHADQTKNEGPKQPQIQLNFNFLSHLDK